jgi:phage FluMu protein Com
MSRIIFVHPSLLVKERNNTYNAKQPIYLRKERYIMLKCPKCEKNIVNLNTDEATLGGTFNRLSIRGIVITCPHCNTVLSAIADPYAFAGDTKEDISKEVQKQVRSELENFLIRL